jgi:hypothetical protein
MAKVKVIFDLNDPDDIMSHRRFTQSTDMALALWDIKNNLRGKLKHPPEDITDGEYKLIEKIQTEFFEILEDYNINIDKLIE